MHAERVAWDFVANHPLELVTINPGLVLGPLPRRQQATSMEVIRLLLARKLPAVPRLSFAVADVRDIAALLATAFGPRGYRIPTRTLPYWLMWANARFDRTVRLALSYYGVPLRRQRRGRDRISLW
jgi:nucleoside-diphosphate-sugar epimerase